MSQSINDSDSTSTPTREHASQSFRRLLQTSEEKSADPPRHERSAPADSLVPLRDKRHHRTQFECFGVSTQFVSFTDPVKNQHLTRMALSTRPEPEDTIWGFHTHPFGKLPYPSDGDKITSTRYGRPESMIGETQIGTFNPHSRSNGEPPLRILAR